MRTEQRDTLDDPRRDRFQCGLAILLLLATRALGCLGPEGMTSETSQGLRLADWGYMRPGGGEADCDCSC